MILNLTDFPPIVKGFGSRSEGMVWYNNDAAILPAMAALLNRWAVLNGPASWVIRLANTTSIPAIPISISQSSLRDRYGELILPPGSLTFIPAIFTFSTPAAFKGWLPGGIYSEAPLTSAPVGAVAKELNAARTAQQTTTVSPAFTIISPY